MMKKVRARLNLDALRSLLKRGAIPYVVAGGILLLGVSGVAAATGTLSTGSTATPTASPAAATASSSQQAAGFPAAGGGNNIVQVINHHDGSFKMDGRVQLNQIPGPNAGPKNEAFAYSSCLSLSCRTLAVALQINLIRLDARNVQPENQAAAINFECNGCTTCATAIQYTFMVSDPTQPSSEVRELMRQMNAAFIDIKTANISLEQAEARIDGVIGSFQDLVGDQVRKHICETNTMTPGASPMPDQSSSPAASGTPTVSGSPTASPTPSLQATPSSSP
jgi:putative peptide zinc metalloprotease protein